MLPISLSSWLAASRMFWVRRRMTSERLFSLPNLDKLVDEIFVRLQHLQQARELRASVVKFLVASSVWPCNRCH